jgi:putative addiction module CopG family antidote
MNVTIPPEFAAFASEQVAAGTFASEEEAVGIALRSYLVRLEELRALIQEGLDSGEPVDGEVVFAELLAELEARVAVEA